MDFVSAMRQIMVQRISLSIKYQDERLKVHRQLRRQQNNLWAQASDDDLVRCARASFSEMAAHGCQITFTQCLADAQSARQRAQQRLLNTRCW